MKLLRNRWVTVCVTTAACLLSAVVVSLFTTPLYEANTRLFVSTPPGATLAETYQGNRYSQERVASYAQLLTGQTLAQRTVDKLGLGVDADDLRSKITASAKLETVLIDVSVLDESPVRARDIANTLSDEFVGLVRELESPEDGSAPDSRVVVEQRATIPDEPVVPKTSRNILLGLVLGIVLGVGLALARDMLDNTVKDKAALEQIVGTGLVGTIPLDKDRRKTAAISFDDNTTTAESFRKLRTNLQFLSVDNPPRVIVVSSSMPHEGKTTTAINIALALAEADSSVVLVDGDMRRPALAKYLGLVGQVGFSTVLSGGASLSEAMQKTRFAGLTVLTSGAIPPNPSELLGSQTARNLLLELRSKFDYVIVDSTPLLAVTDAAILAAGADGVLLMARFGQTKRDQLTHAVGTLESVGAALLGAVFTMVPNRGTNSYHYSYGYYGEEGSRRSAGASNKLSAPNSSPMKATDAEARVDERPIREESQPSVRRRRRSASD